MIELNIVYKLHGRYLVNAADFDAAVKAFAAGEGVQMGVESREIGRITGKPFDADAGQRIFEAAGVAPGTKPAAAKPKRGAKPAAKKGRR